jgi:hypothetical protein
MGKGNTYICDNCGKVFKTETLDDGVTPFIINCHNCNGDAISQFFDCPQQVKPDYYWFKPTNKQLKAQVEWELDWMGSKGFLDIETAYQLQKEHVDKGGLVLGPDNETIKGWSE